MNFEFIGVKHISDLNGYVLHNWYNKGCGLCYHVCGIAHIKEPLLLIGKSSPCEVSRFPLAI